MSLAFRWSNMALLLLRCTMYCALHIYEIPPTVHVSLLLHFYVVDCMMQFLFPKPTADTFVALSFLTAVAAILCVAFGNHGVAAILLFVAVLLITVLICWLRLDLRAVEMM